MKNLILITLLLNSWTSLLYSQTVPSIVWQKSLGGTNNDYANCVQQTTDGGFIVAGYSYSNDDDVSGHHGLTSIPDYWIAKLDSSGILIWQKSYGGSDEDQAYSVQQTSDSGYIVAGFTRSNEGDITINHGLTDYWILKLSSIGNIEWQKSLGGTGADVAFSIQQTNDEGYIVAGFSWSSDGDVTANNGQSDAWIVKLNDTGNIVWQKSLGGTVQEIARSIKQTSEDSYIIAGGTFSNNGDVSGNHSSFAEDYWVVKLDTNGNLIWQKCLGGILNDEAYSVQLTADGGFIITGNSESQDGDVTGHHGNCDNDVACFDYWVVKLGTLGNLEWQKSLGGISNDEARSVQQTTDHGFIVAGLSLSTSGDIIGNHGSSDYWLAKLDTIGNLTWQKALGGTGSEQANSILQNVVGGFVVTGNSSSNNGDVSGHHGSTSTYDYWPVRLSSDGSCSFPTATQASISAGGATTFCDGDNVVLQVAASGFIYQWKKDGANISGATLQSYTATESGAYSCAVSNSCGVTPSNSITVTVNTSPTATQAAISPGGAVTFCAQGTVVLNVATSGLTYQWKKGGGNISGATLQDYTAKASGTFTCKVSNTCGDITSNAIVVTENPKPSATVTAAPCSNGAVLLTCTADPNTGVNYQWKKKNDVISGATNPTYSATQNSKYKCTVTITATGCTKTSNVMSVTISCKNSELVYESETLDQFLLYPNPASTQLQLIVPQLDNKYEITILNALGQIMQQQVLLSGNDEGSISINIEDLAAGTYFLQIKNDPDISAERAVKKFVKE